jgi:hypothetical protein
MHVSVQWHIFQELKLVDVNTATWGEWKRLKFWQMVFHLEISYLKEAIARLEQCRAMATCKMTMQKGRPPYGG